MAGLSLVTLGMEWVFQFWRRLRYDPVSTIYDEVDSALEMARERNLLVLGSVAGAASVLYAGLAVLFVCWGTNDWDEAFTRLGMLTKADWTQFSGRAVGAIVVWGILASWLSTRMRHPFLPAPVVQLLGVVFRIGVAATSLWVGYQAWLRINHSLGWDLFGAVILSAVLISTWTGGLGRWSKLNSSVEENPNITAADYYPFSYVCLCSFFLLLGFICLAGVPAK